MESTINQILTVFRTYRPQFLSNRSRNNLSGKGFSDKLANKESDKISDNINNEISSNSTKIKTLDSIRKNRLKYSTNEENKVVVQIIRDKTGKIIRTIPLSEQHALDIIK